MNEIIEHRNRAWTTILRAIFEQQRLLMQQYKEIEQLPAAPLPLHTPRSQVVLKDFAWRTTEELCEAYNALVSQVRQADEPHPIEAFTELADALHFFVELMIFAGVTADQCSGMGYPSARVPVIEELYWRTHYQLGMAMHELKCKPWKQTPVATNEGAFRSRLLIAFEAFIALWSVLGATPADVDRHYFRKHRTNQTRIAEKY
jgi:hypothetical protein